MHSVTKRELNQRTASVLDGVTATDDAVITERGEPRWRISAYGGGPQSALERMQRDGRYTAPRSAPAPWPERPDGPRYCDADVTALLDEMRGNH